MSVNKTGKNYDKYRFNNESTLLSKGKLAERIIREYFIDYSNLKYSDIKKDFNFKIPGYTTIYNEADYLEWDERRSSDRTRYSESIEYKGENYYITTQWEPETINTLIAKAEKDFKYTIEVIKAEDNSEELISQTSEVIKKDDNKLLNNNSVTESDEDNSEEEILKQRFSDKEIKYNFNYKNILLKGVPGTGKSRTLDTIINEEKYLNLEEHQETNVLRINIHSASSNADLMQGIGISSNSNGNIEYKEKQGLILELIEKATFMPNQPFVLVLEEIQENSLNELIGDLIYLIEKDKRADGYVADNKEYSYPDLIDNIMNQNKSIKSIKLPSLISQNQKVKRMIIPENLFIFCTSNYRDDRKVIEDNLLRRFEVIEIYPKYKDTIGDDFKSDEVSKFLEALNKSIVSVCRGNGEIHPDRFMIGHSIWLDVENKKDFSRAFLKVITEFKDVKDMHFDDFKKIVKDLEFPFDVEKEYGNYEEWIEVLQTNCYDFLKL